jgi:mRNA interferase MazF
MGVVAVSRFDVVLVRLDPTEGSEISKTRPSVVISPDEINQSLRTVIVAPMTTGGHPYPWRVDVAFARRSGRIALDQLRAIDGSMIVRRLGNLDTRTAQKTLDTLAEMFAS